MFLNILAYDWSYTLCAYVYITVMESAVHRASRYLLKSLLWELWVLVQKWDYSGQQTTK